MRGRILSTNQRCLHRRTSIRPGTIGGAIVLVALLSLALQLLMADDATAQSVIGKPDVAVAGSLDGALEFSWQDDPAAEFWAVAVVNGSCSGLSSDSAVTANQVSCSADPSALGPVCVSVKAYNETTGSVSAFSNWRCADGDAFAIDATGAGYLPNEVSLGRVRADEALAPTLANATDCVVDLSFQPYRYVCVASGAAIDQAIADLAAVATASERVFWIGAPGDVVVEDYEPVSLVADLAFEDDLDAAVLGDGLDLQTTYTVTNQVLLSAATGIAPSVGVTLPIAAGFDKATITAPEFCTVVKDDLRCLLGDLAVGDQASFTVTGTPLPGATAGQFGVVAVVDTDIPGVGEAFEGENAGSDAGGSVSGTGTNGRSRQTSAVFDFGEDPGVFLGTGSTAGGPLDGGSGEVTGLPACQFCAAATTGTSGDSTSSSAPEAFSGGDPHVRTFDGVRLPFHGSGDYLGAQSSAGAFEMQVRFGRYGNGYVSFNWGLAVRAGDSVLTFGDDESLTLWDDTLVKLNDVLVTPTVGGQTLAGGVTLRRVDSGIPRYEVLWPDGTRLWVGMRVGDAWRVLVGPNVQQGLEGLLGNADGDPTNDLVARSGTPFDYNSVELYTIFGDSWAVDPASSMFSTDLADGALLPFLPTGRFSMSELAAAALAEAEAACRAAGFVESEGLAECIFDLAVTGDQRLIEGSRLIQSLMGESISALAAFGIVEDDTTVAAPAVIVGEITTSYKVDLYRFDLEQGASVTIDSARTCTNPSSFEFVLEAPSGAVVARNGYSTTTACGRIGLFDLPESGEYILRVYDRFGATGQYALAVALPGSGSSAYRLDEVATGSVDAGGEHFHIFQVDEDDTEVYFDSQGCNNYNRWQLLNPELQVVRSVSCASEFAEVLSAGQWAVRFYSDDTRSGSYSFRTWVLPERETFVYALDESVSGSLAFPTDAHRYVFDVAADETEVFFDPNGCASGLRWRLIDPAGTPGPFEYCFESFSQVLDAGMWALEVYSIDDRSGSYSFRAWEIPERETFVYALDDVASGSLSFPTDRERHVFDIAADGAEVYFQSRGCNTYNWWRLIDATGSVVTTKRCTADFAEVLSAGTWTLEMYSVDDRFGSYSFRVWEIPQRETFDYVIGDTANVVLSFPTDNETYTFDVAVDGTALVFDSQGCSPTSQRWLLRRPDGSLVVWKYCYQDFTATLDAGTHTLMVYTNDDRFGTMQFQVREQ